MLKMNEAVYTPEGPQPLIRETPPPEPFPVTALGALQEVAEAVAGETLAPVAMAAGSALAVASLAVQGHADVVTLGGARPLSLYVLTIAKSGERKSTADRLLMRGLREVEEIGAAQFQKDQAAFVLASEMYQAMKKAALAAMGGKKSIGAEADLRALGDAPSAPISPFRTMAEPTAEALYKALQAGQPAQGLFSDEGGAFMGGFSMSADHRQKTMALLNSAWDGSALDRLRVGDGASRIYGRRLALHLMVQPSIAHGFIGAPLTGEIGFLPRCLICEPASTIGGRFSYLVKPNPAALEAFASRLKQVLAEPTPLAEDGRSLKPRLLKLSPQARVVLTQYADEVEAESGPGRAFSHLTGTASKAAEQAARISGVLTLWDDLSAEAVSFATMIDAIELARFYLSEASRLSSASTISEEIADAEKLRLWLLSSWGEADIAKSEVLQFGPACCRESGKADHAAALLERHGWLIPLPEGVHLRGKPRKLAWRINRANPH
jgi:hypothetical protein